MTLISELTALKAELHSIPVDLGLPTYRTFAIRKSYLPEDEIVPELRDYLIYPKCKITNVPRRMVNDSFSNGTVILSQDDLLIHNLPRLYTLEFLKEGIEHYIIDPIVGENDDWDDIIVSGIQCQLIDVLDDSALHWKIVLRRLSDRYEIDEAPLEILRAPRS